MDIKTKFKVGSLVNAMKDNRVVDLEVKKIIITVNSSNISVDYVTEYIYRTYKRMDDYTVHREEYIVPEYKCFKNKKELLESL